MGSSRRWRCRGTRGSLRSNGTPNGLRTAIRFSSGCLTTSSGRPPVGNGRRRPFRLHYSNRQPPRWSNEGHLMLRWFLYACTLAVFAPALRADDLPEFERTRDVIYGRKYGVCLTMDVFTLK